MLTYLYEWIKNITFYLVIITAVIHVIPSSGYKKYVQFFTGLVLVVLLITPFLKVAGMEHGFYEMYHNTEYEQQKKEIEDTSAYLEDIDVFDYLPEEYRQNVTQEEAEREIEVEEIEIGR